MGTKWIMHVYQSVQYLAYIYIYIYGFPSGSDGKESACNAGNLGSIPRSGRVPEEGKMDNVCLSISIISSI